MKQKRVVKGILAFVLTLAMVLGAVPLPQFTMVARAETNTSSVTIGGTDYTLYTGFTATAGTASYANFVDGNTLTEWQVIKNIGSNTRDFAGGEEDPAYVEFHADAPFIPKGYILTYNSSNANWKPTSWALKAKLNESDNWTTIHSSNSSLGNGSRFEIACNNDGDNKYQYFRFEIYDVGTTYQSVLDELEFYGNSSYTHLTVRSATCTEIGIKQECWQRDSDGKYFSDANGTTELDESAVVEPMKAHTCVHHEASANNTEYWQCSVCGKYFSDSSCTNEISEAEATIGVFGELADGRYTLSSQTYTLTGDENTAGYIYVPEGVTATIDLNGHTIDRGLTSADNNGSVIIVKGTLTITDSSTGGKVQGGYDAGDGYSYYTSCVKVLEGSTFNLQGGTLIGRVQDYDYTVSVVENSYFTMTGGKITGGRTGVLADGNVTLTGGEISGNSQYGVYFNTDNFSVSGNPVITNNTEANVKIFGWFVINVVGALTDGANIGITAYPSDNAPVTITSGYGTYNNNVSPSTYFSLDNNGQIQIGGHLNPQYMTVVMGWNEDKTEIAVGTASRTVNFDLQGHGSNIEAVSLLNGYKLIEPTEPTAEGWNFGGWYTDANCTDDSEWSFNSGVTSDMTLYALWTQGQTYRVTLPENMLLVSADNEAVGGKYPTGTNIRFKVKSADYVVDGDVKNGEDVLTADGDGIYTITVADADITITATVKKAAEPNKTLSGSESYTAQDGDVLTGSTSGTVTIASGAGITLSDVTISGGIVCNGTATITLVGTNSVSGATNKAGIQIGGSGTTLTIKGNGSLTANGGDQSAGIGLSRAWDVDNTGGNIVIEGGNITANGGSKWGAGIGTGVIYGNGSAKTARIGNITIKGGTVKATGGSDADGIGTGYTYSGCTNAIGTVTIYDGIDKIDASSIKNSGSIVYKHEENDVTASTSDYFTIIENGNRRIIVQKVTPTIADVPDQTYTGSAITPEPTVIAGSLSLTKGTDYVYSYTNNTDAGTATVRATFQGDYASLGYVEKTFKINNQSTHNFTYSASSNTITAICSEDACPLEDQKATLTINAPESLIYDGAVKTATISGDTNVLGTPEISYQKKTGDNTWGDATNTTPMDVGTYKASITLGTGSSAATASVEYTIAPKSVTIKGLSAENKTYDGTTTATVTGTSAIDGVLDADRENVTVSGGTASFDNANTGTDKTVTFSGYSLSGTAAGNYTLSAQPASVTANITARAITITAKAQSVEVGGSIATGTDQVSVTGDGIAADQSISAITLTPTSTDAVTTNGTITPSAAIIMDSDHDVTGNYNINYTNGVLTVTNAQVYISGVTAGNKTYDGSTSATITGTPVLKLVRNNSEVSDLSITGAITAVFSDKNAGTGKTVTISAATLSDETGYTLNIDKSNEKLGLTADIIPKSVTITGITANERNYDPDDLTVELTGGTVSGVEDGDTVTVDLSNASGTIADANAGTDKAVTVTGVKLGGTDAGNYTLSAQPTDVKVTINKIDYTGSKEASVTVRSEQVTTDATLTLPALPDGAESYGEISTSGELISGTPSVSGRTLTFSTTNQENDTSATITIAVTGATNYNDYSVVVTVTAKDMDEAGVTINGGAAKTVTYGTADFTLAKTVNNAGTGTGVWTWESSDTSVAEIGGNTGSITIKKTGRTTITAKYESDTTIGEASIVLTVDPKTLGITWSNTSFTYDGTSHVPTATLSGVKSGDACTVSVSGAQTNAGTGYTATASLSGAAAGNYTLQEDKKTRSFSISRASLTVTAKPKTITYGSAPSNDGVTYSGFVNNESTGVLKGTLSYDYNYTQYGNVGSYSITPKGLIADNYTISFVSGTLTVDQKEVGLTWSNTPLTFNGSAQAPTATATGLVNGDTVSVTVTGAQTNAGTGYTATASGLTGAKAGNYKLPAANTKTFSIAKAATQTLTDITMEQAYSKTAVNTSATGKMPANAGTLSYTAGTAAIKKVSGSTTKVTDYTVDTAGKLSATVADGTAGDVITLPLTITSANYEDSSLKVVVTLLDKTEAGVTITEGASLKKTYGDAAFTIHGSVTDPGTGSGVWSYESSNEDVATITNAGVVTITGGGTTTITASYESDTTIDSTTLLLTVHPKSVAIPTAETGLKWTGSEQTGVADGEGYTVTDGAKTEVGDYTATATLNSTTDYQWSDETTDAKTVSWNIGKATPTISSVPTAGTITYGDTLADSMLTGGEVTGVDGNAITGNFAWTMSTAAPKVADSNTTEYSVTFTPTDTEHYNSATCKVKLKVNPKSSDGNAEDPAGKQETTTVKEKGTAITDASSKAEVVVTSKAGEEPTVAFTKADDTAKSVEVPETVVDNGITYKVTMIADGAFMGNKNLESVKMSNNITTLGKNAFEGCTKLKSVTLSKNITKIPSAAFKDCKALRSIKLDNVTEIGEAAFENCSSLKSLTIGSKTTKIGKKAFKGTGVKTLVIKTSKLTKKSIKGALTGSKVKTIKVKAGSKKQNKAVIKKYKKIFTKKIAGRKVTIK